MSIKQDLLQKTKDILRNMPTQKGREPDVIQQIKRIKVVITTLSQNIEMMDENLITMENGWHHNMLNFLTQIYNSLSDFKNDNDNNRLYQINKDYISNIISTYSEFYLFPYQQDKQLIEKNKIVQESFDSTIDYVKKKDQKIQNLSLRIEKLQRTLRDIYSILII